MIPLLKLHSLGQAVAYLGSVPISAYHVRKLLTALEASERIKTIAME
jgi:hypothetical protein